MPKPKIFEQKSERNTPLGSKATVKPISQKIRKYRSAKLNK